MVSKRKRNHIEKAISKSKGAGQILLQQQKPTLYENEFTIHKSIEKALREFVIKARELEVNKKQLVNSVAFEIENELKKMNRPELICHISDVMLGALRRNKVNWSIAYLRKTLPEKYKDPTKRQSALTRFQRAGPPGTPPDTGKTTEELEASLNRKSSAVVGRYTVKCTMSLDEPVNTLAIDHDDDTTHYFLPVIANVNAAEQTATVELDKAEYDAFKKRVDDWNQLIDETVAEAEEKQKRKPKSTKTKTKTKTKKTTIIDDDYTKEMTDEEWEEQKKVDRELARKIL
jgi:hypothetical protein